MYKNLFVCRKEIGVTQERLGAMLGVSKQTYHLKEKKKSDFTISEAILLSKFFDKGLDELFID